MNFRSQRGAARVSAVWLIVLIVLFLVALAFGFIAHGDMANERDKATAAEASEAEAIEASSAQADVRRNISEVLGFYNRESADPSSDIEAAKAAIDDLKQTFQDLGAGDADFESVLPKIKAAYNQRVKKIGELESRITTLESEVSSANDTVSSVTRAKDQEIATLRQTNADDNQNASSRQDELETRLATLNDQLSERDQEVRSVRADAKAREEELRKRVLTLEARVANLSDDANVITKPKFADAPDGKIVEVSSRLSLGWINIGSNQRVTRGTVFSVESGTPGSRRKKASAEVTRVQANRSEVIFTDLADRFDPVVPGDVIVNPLFDPTGERNAVLVGRFSGQFNRREIELLLKRMSINVQEEMDLTTHFLIVGSEMWNDPQTNEPLDEPIQPSELPVYKDALGLGVQVIPVQNIREFFRATDS